MGEEEKPKKNNVFVEVESPGVVDVTDDDPGMLQRFADETGSELIINKDPQTGRRKAKVVQIAVIPKKT